MVARTDLPLGWTELALPDDLLLIFAAWFRKELMFVGSSMSYFVGDMLEPV